MDYQGITSRRAVVALAVILVSLKTYSDSLEQQIKNIIAC